MSTPPAAAAASNKRKRIAPATEPVAAAAAGPRPFLAGDRVRRTSSGGGLVDGATGTVIQPPTGQWITVQWDPPYHGFGVTLQWDSMRMEHLDPLPSTKKAKADAASRPFLVGDRVRRVQDGIGHYGPPLGTLGTVTKIGVAASSVAWDAPSDDFMLDGWDNWRMEHVDPLPPAVATSTVTIVEPLDGPAAAAAAGEIKWIETTPTRYNNIELVQEDIAAGVRCTKSDLGRLGSEYLDRLLLCADEEKLARITIANGTCATPEILHTLFQVLLPAWSEGPTGIETTDRVAVQILHAADALDLYFDKDFDPSRAQLLALVAESFPAISHVELAEIGIRYHWKEMIQAVAARLKQLESIVAIPNAVLLACAPYWRASK